MSKFLSLIGFFDLEDWDTNFELGKKNKVVEHLLEEWVYLKNIIKLFIRKRSWLIEIHQSFHLFICIQYILRGCNDLIFPSGCININCIWYNQKLWTSKWCLPFYLSQIHLLLHNRYQFNFYYNSIVLL